MIQKYGLKLVVLLSVLFGTASCSLFSGIDAEDVVGRWRTTIGKAWEEILYESDNTFTSKGDNGSGETYKYTGTYSVGNNTLTMNYLTYYRDSGTVTYVDNYFSQTVPYSAEIEYNMLTLTYDGTPVYYFKISRIPELSVTNPASLSLTTTNTFISIYGTAKTYDSSLEGIYFSMDNIGFTKWTKVSEGWKMNFLFSVGSHTVDIFVKDTKNNCSETNRVNILITE